MQLVRLTRLAVIGHPVAMTEIARCSWGPREHEVTEDDRIEALKTANNRTHPPQSEARSLGQAVADVGSDSDMHLL